MYNETRLQDINSEIKMIKSEDGWFDRLTNRIACLWRMFQGSKKRLKILYFEKGQEEQRKDFFNEL